MSLRDEIKTGKLYFPDEDGLMAEQQKYMELLYDFNATRPSQSALRIELLKKLFSEIGDGCWVEPPLYANWGCNVHFGSCVYANFGLTLVDDADIFVGDDVMFAPHVTVATAGHPISPVPRKQGAQFNITVHIGNNVWLGAGAIVLPGVTIGDNSVIGAGSVVTKDIPADVVAVGNPCRVLRTINEHDREFYYKELKIPENFKSGR